MMMRTMIGMGMMMGVMMGIWVYVVGRREGVGEGGSWGGRE